MKQQLKQKINELITLNDKFIEEHFKKEPQDENAIFILCRQNNSLKNLITFSLDKMCDLQMRDLSAEIEEEIILCKKVLTALKIPLKN